MSCEALVPQIVQLSERNNAGTLQPTILKVYEAELVRANDTEVRCRADALLSTNARVPITFSWWTDADGDPFISYQQDEQDAE